jgi:hypothetical protein
VSAEEKEEVKYHVEEIDKAIKEKKPKNLIKKIFKNLEDTTKGIVAIQGLGEAAKNIIDFFKGFI